MAGEYKKIFWTEHCKIKMRQYGLSKSKLLKLIYKPERIEQGIAPKTVAVMQSNNFFQRAIASKIIAVPMKKAPKAPGEIWLMYQDVDYQRRIISAWRYPGISKPGDSIPIPAEIKQELEKEYL